MKKIIFTIFLFCGNALLLGQTVSGKVFEKNSKRIVEFVNIGIVGKNVGTVSDQNGRYSLQINPEYNNDILRFSCIGYQPYSVKVSDFIKRNNGDVSLEKQIFELAETVIRPKIFLPKTLGITTKSKRLQAGFKDSVGKGYEAGVLMSNKKTAFIKTINLNISRCSYDSIFYRVNIYKVHKKNRFENILQAPIYVNLTKQEIKDKITIDVRHLNLIVEGDFLVTFEHVKDLGPGDIFFCAALFHTTYGRKTSQGAWKRTPVGISLSVDADVEK